VEPSDVARGGGRAQIQILGIPGSVRDGSHNVALLRNAAQVLPGEAELALVEQPHVASLPGFDPTVPSPEPVEELRRAVVDADALLLATPEYNGSLPGVLKNAIDWVAAPAREGPIRGVPVAVVGADRSEIGPDWAHADARKVLEAAGARVIRTRLAIGAAAAAFTGDGRLAEPEHEENLRRVLDELISESRAPG